MRIGELARRTGKSVAALRYYEQVGLLDPSQRTEAGYRDYPPQTEKRVRFIASAQERGFSLREIKAVLALSDTGRAPCAGVVRVAYKKVERLDRRIAQLQERRDLLAQAVQLHERGLLAEAPFCPVLNSIPTEERGDPRRRQGDMGRIVEVFIAGCPLCDEAVKLVRATACPNCEVKVYDLRKGCATNECRDLAARYGVQAVPAVVVDGQIADCCRGGGVTEAGLRAAGVGSG